MHSRLWKNSGLQVNVQKEYSDTDDNGYALVDPGYVYNVEPASRYFCAGRLFCNTDSQSRG